MRDLGFVPPKIPGLTVKPHRYVVAAEFNGREVKFDKPVSASQAVAALSRES